MTIVKPSAAGGPELAGDRPPISAPRHLRSSSDVEAARARAALQPGLGLKGLLLVLPIAVLLAAGAGGPESSALVLGPLVTYSLPLVAMVAFWWEDWPGTRLRPRWSGWVDTALVAVGGVVLTAVGQALAGGLDARGIFDPSPGPGHVPTFPATMPLAGAAFVAMLQLTLVGEGWPLRRLPPIPAGLAAVAVSWAIALAIYVLLPDVRAPAGSRVASRHGPVGGADLGSALVVVSAWQVVLYVLWHGWPFAAIASRGRRLACAHVGTIGAGIASYLLARAALGLGAVPIAAAAGCFVAAGLLVGMLLEGWLQRSLSASGERVITLLASLALGALTALVLRAVAGSLSFTRASPDEWVEHAGLNAIAVSTILHVAIGRRWPFGPAHAG
jgi:hypothetical protein